MGSTYLKPGGFSKGLDMGAGPFWQWRQMRKGSNGLKMIRQIAYPPQYIERFSRTRCGSAVFWGVFPPKTQKTAENQGISPSSQNGHLSYRETTVREYRKNTLLPPPLTPPQQFSLSKKEEEEEKKIKFEFENAQQHSDQGLDPSDLNPDRDLQENLVFSDMISIWNRTVQEKLNFGQEVHLTEKRKAFLGQFLKTVLACKGRDEQLDAWKVYCTLIANSRFLAGENTSGFKASLDWALIPGNAYKILEGAIFDKPAPILQSQPEHQSWEAFAQEVANTLPSSPYGKEWLQISQHLAKRLDQTRYKSWFSTAYLEEVAGATAVLRVDGNFIKSYIENNFQGDILYALQAIYPGVNYIDFQACPQSGESFGVRRAK